ncbi:MAG: HEAT repeat domain-containing protein [Spirochaetales bacterium]|nr:HEAT repeat domain-containing protein [Spirochaetales bacterium]
MNKSLKCGGFVLILFLLIAPMDNYLPAQEDEGGNGTETEEENPQEETEGFLEYRRNTLRFGINDKILEVVKSLRAEKDERLNEQLKKTIQETKNPQIQQEILKFFREQKNDSLTQQAHDFLTDDAADQETRRAAFRYLSAVEYAKAVPAAMDIISEPGSRLIASALQYIAETGKDFEELDDSKLIELLDDPTFPRNYRPELLRTLGKLKSKQAFERIITIVKDPGAEQAMRWFACEALAGYGDPSAVTALSEALQTEDTTLRTYAVAALGTFSTEEAKKAVVGATKDNFWKVRLEAAKALGKQRHLPALEILEYQIKHDPVPQIRAAAVKAVAAMGTKESEKIVSEVFTDSSYKPDLRLAALRGMIEKDITPYRDALDTVFDQQGDKKQSPFFQKVCRELSFSPAPVLKDYYARMLTHHDPVINIHGIRGIRLNGYGELKHAVEELVDRSSHRSVLRHARSALDSL